MIIAKYDTNTRRVIMQISMPSLINFADHGQEVEEGEAITTCPDLGFDQIYADPQGNIVAKQPKVYSATQSNIVADGVDSARIENLSPGTRFEVWRGSEVVYSGETDDGVIELTTDLEGAYTVWVDELEYLKGGVEIACTAAA